MTAPRPGALLRSLLRAVLPAADRDAMAVEMDELWKARRERHGRVGADLWYLRAVLGFAVRVGAAGSRERVVRWLRDGAADLRYGARVLGRRPGYAAAAMVTLGLGVGGLTAVYAAADRVLLRPVPGVQVPGELVTLRLGSTEGPRASWAVSHPDLRALRAALEGASSLAARTSLDVNLSFVDGAAALRVPAAVVTPDWFSVLGVSWSAGRPLSAASDPASSGVGEVVVSHDLALELAPRAVEAVGRTVLVDGVVHRIVGVAGPGFRGAELPGETRMWLGPAALLTLEPGAPADLFEQGTRRVWEVMVGRRAEGVPVEAVRAAAERMRQESRRTEAASATVMVEHFTFQAFEGVGLDPSLRGPVRRTVTFLAAGAAFLLLLAAANVANLALTHAASRRTTLSVRRALGAGRGRLLRQVLAEHALLGLGGGVLGVAIAFVGVELFADVRLDEFGASLAGLGLGPKAMAAALGLAMITALAAAGAAALVSGGADDLGALRSIRAGSRRGRRLRASLAAFQVALSTVLVVGSGLMARSVANLRGIDLGFRPDGVLAFTLDPSRIGRTPAEVTDLLARLQARLEAEPGVEAAGFAAPEPLRTSYVTSFLVPPGADRDDGLLGAHLQVAGGFLEAMGVEWLAGPFLDEREWSRTAEEDEASVVVTRSAAAALFPGRSPAEVAGMVVSRGGPDDPPIRIAGVVNDLRITGPRADPPPAFIRPWRQGFDLEEAVGWVRARSGRTPELAATVRRVVREADPFLPVYDVRTVRAQADRMFADQRVLAGLGVVISVLGLILAAVGLHGVLGYAVAERRREIGIRTALGAKPGDVLGRVVGGGLTLTLAGLLPGLAGAAILTRLLESYLYGVTRLDPATWVLGVALLAAVAALASWVPARRATRVPVVEVLRAEG